MLPFNIDETYIVNPLILHNSYPIP